MARRIWCKDGLLQWFETRLRENSVEVAEGWRVVINSKVLEQITQKFRSLIRANRVSRICHHDDGTKHKKSYEWQSDVYEYVIRWNFCIFAREYRVIKVGRRVGQSSREDILKNGVKKVSIAAGKPLPDSLVYYL